MSNVTALFIGINQANTPVVIALSKFYVQLVCTSDSISSVNISDLPKNIHIVCLSSNYFASCLRIALVIKPVLVYSWGSNFSHFIAVKLSDALSLNDVHQRHNNIACDWSRNSRFLELKEYLRNAKVTTLYLPEFYILSIRDALNVLEFPICTSNAAVLKVNSLATQGFCLYVDSFVSDLSPYIPILTEHIDPNDSSIFVQQFIDGEHYSADAFVIEGQPVFILTGQKVMSPDDLFHTQSVSYNNISSSLEILLSEAIFHCVSCFSIQNGFIHLELCTYQSKLYVIDITLRPPGSLSSSIIYPFISRYSLTNLFGMRFNSESIYSMNNLNLDVDKRMATLYHIDLSEYGDYLSFIDEEKISNDPLVLDYLVDSSLLRPLSGHENNRPRSLILAIDSSHDYIQASKFNIDSFIHQYFSFL